MIEFILIPLVFPSPIISTLSLGGAVKLPVPPVGAILKLDKKYPAKPLDTR